MLRWCCCSVVILSLENNICLTCFQDLVLGFVRRVFGETPKVGRKHKATWQPQSGVRVLDTAAVCAQLDAKAESLEALLGYMEVRDCS